MLELSDAFSFRNRQKKSLITDFIFVLHKWQITICLQKHTMKYKKDLILNAGDVGRFQFQE